MVHSRVPDHAPVLDADLLVRLVDRAQLLDALVEGLLRTTRIPQSASTSIRTNSRVQSVSPPTPAEDDTSNRNRNRAKNTDAPEDSRISLHSLLHIQPNLRRRQRAVRLPDLVEELDALQARLRGHLLVRLARCQRLLDVVRARAPEDDDVQERVRAEPVRAVHGHARGLACGVQPGHDLVLAVLVLRDDLAGVPGGDTTH